MVISKKDGFDYDLIFLGHLDVVDNPDLSSYTPKVIGNTLHGRGISDMKAATAGMIQLFLDNSQNPQFENYALVMTTDEQIGGFNGTAHLIEDYGLKAKVVFNPDGGHPLNPSISEKGILQIKLTATGKAAHGSRPWEGMSAIDLLNDDIERVKQQFSYGDIDHQGNITFNLGTIKGGEATNAVPAMAEATIDLRYPPTLTVSVIEEKIRNALKNSKLEIINSADPVSIEPDDEALLDLMRALLKQGRIPSLMHETGGCDARWFTPQGSSILLMRLEGTGGLIDDEYVTITGLSNYYLVMENFLDEIADNF
ncbi:MAG: M20/M25/M40 family metallo-hydrolase [Emcibacteraceae bacterium]